MAISLDLVLDKVFRSGTLVWSQQPLRGTKTAVSWKVRGNRGRAGTSRAGTRAETSRADPSRAETSRADTSRADTSRAETSRAETSKADASRAEISRAAYNQVVKAAGVCVKLEMETLLQTQQLGNAGTAMSSCWL